MSDLPCARDLFRIGAHKDVIKTAEQRMADEDNYWSKIGRIDQ